MKKRLTAMVLALCVFASVFLGMPAARAAEGSTVYVVANTLPVYQSASTSSKLLGTMGFGQDMTRLAENGNWAMVRNAAGAIGYCANDALSVTSPNTMNVTASINTANAPLYKVPSASTAIWMRLPKGATFTAVAMTRDNDWVRLKNGNYYGYMQAKYLTTANASPTPNPTASPPSGLAGKVYVTATSLPVYLSASASSKCLGTMYYGQDMTCLAVSGSWAQVRNSAGAIGYCQVSGISGANPNNLAQKIYISVDSAPIYKVPSTSAAVWMYLKRNQSYTAVAVTPDGTWTRIQNGNYFAYILTKHISSSTPTPSPTAAPTPAPTQSIAGTYYANAATVTVYQTASASAKVLGVFSYGESVTVVAGSGEWAQVRSSAGATGYCRLSELTTKNPNTYAQTVYISADSAPIYKVASSSSAIWMYLKKNQSYTAVAITPDGAWFRLQNGNYFAYIPSKYVSASRIEDPPALEQTVYVTVSSLPVYASASASSKCLGNMCIGESMTMIGASDGWAKVRNAEGALGYCLSSSLSTKDINTLNRPYYAKNKTVTLYSRSYNGAKATATVAQNTSLMAVCLSPDGVWARIALSNGSFAYAHTSDLSETRIDDGTLIADITPVTVYVIPTSLPVYASTSTSAKSLGTMYFGQSMTCTGKSSSWARVVNSAGTVGYCDLNSITTANPNIYATTLYAQVSGAKVYKAPSTSYAVLTTLPLNGLVTGVSYNSDRSWYRVQCGSEYGYVEARYFATSPINTGQSSAITKVVTLAQQFIGVPYVYAGQSPSGFDCSGFVYYVFKNAAGITLNRTAYTQGYDDRYPKITNKADLKVGDVLFFNTVTTDSDLCDHAGIYLGNNQFIHASSGGGKVMISSLGTNDSSYYYRTYSWARRIIN